MDLFANESTGSLGGEVGEVTAGGGAGAVGRRALSEGRGCPDGEVSGGGGCFQGPRKCAS